MPARSSTPRPWVDGLTFAEVLERTASRYAGHDALVFPQIAYRRSYAALQAEARQVARALLALGVEPGEHVGIWATNLPQWVLAQFAAAAIGAPLVNINPAYRASELGYVLKQADITTLLLTDRFKTSNYFDMLDQVCPELASSTVGELRSAACPRLRRVISVRPEGRPGVLNWDEFVQRGRSVSPSLLAARQAAVDPDDIVSIQFTSGTTGFPKGAQLTHRNLLLNAYHVGQRLAFTDSDRLCIPVPFYHCFGCVLGTLVCVVTGAAGVVPAESFDAVATLRALQDEKCTGLHGVPTMFLAELQHPRFSDFDLRNLRTGMMAGSPCPIELMRAVCERMGARQMTIGYGLTEASPIITETCVDDDVEHRVGTVGTALPGVEVRIVQPGTLDDVPVGEAGELIARGHGIMRGYYNKPAETAAAITPDGWLRSGDLASRTRDGYYRIVGRIKDLIIRGGENIYPREIEEFLYRHPAIQDVQVFGVPDPRYGEELCAWIKIRDGATLTDEDVKAFCKDQIAHYKVPRHIRFVNDFPMTVTGKMQKFIMRETMVAEIGAKEIATA
jgi:fatty-acyl-CoA synthase